MTDTTAKKTKLDPIKLKKLKEEINSELSKAVANSQISQILRNYGITDPNDLHIRFLISPNKSPVRDFARILDSELTCFTNAIGESTYACRYQEEPDSDIIICQNYITCRDTRKCLRTGLSF